MMKQRDRQRMCFHATRIRRHGLSRLLDYWRRGFEFRERIRKMTGAKLIGYGKAAASMADPEKSSTDRTVNLTAIAQPSECRAEW
jgi:hypothetical protein